MAQCARGAAFPYSCTRAGLKIGESSSREWRAESSCAQKSVFGPAFTSWYLYYSCKLVLHIQNSTPGGSQPVLSDRRVKTQMQRQYPSVPFPFQNLYIHTCETPSDRKRRMEIGRKRNGDKFYDVACQCRNPHRHARFATLDTQVHARVRKLCYVEAANESNVRNVTWSALRVVRLSPANDRFAFSCMFDPILIQSRIEITLISINLVCISKISIPI